MEQAKVYKAGLDIGSTTAKIVLLDQNDALVFSDYQRHHAKIYETVKLFLQDILDQEGDCCLDLKLTGSATLGVSKKLDLPFVQEVIATNVVIKNNYPDVSTTLDIGGEDSKIIFLNKDKPPDIRMNGSCAGGTGRFIDQMATLLNITPFQLNDLAGTHDHIYPVASRCGVFAKTDVQNMLSRNIPHKDIAASIFHAVAVQCINSLARGKDIKPKILLCGGVFTFLPELVNIFLRVLNFSDADMVMPERSELIPAIGAAMFDKTPAKPISVRQLIKNLDRELRNTDSVKDRIDPLFKSQHHFMNWKEKAGTVPIQTSPIETYKGKECFIGIDSGSTTTKIVVIGKNKEILYSWYKNNSGNSVKTVIEGLIDFRKQVFELNPQMKIVRSTVAGYGEDLIRAAFNIDKGIVETIAHYMAARFIDPQVSFILDIGGQDMKAIFIDHGVINRIEVNEACSSGCGSFLETLANSLNYSIEEFALLACSANAPCDLGTRCTVFMNSKIKQSLRENATMEDISAGLSYSVIKNCLFKVLKLHNMSEMGDHIVLQGGTFKNPSIVRALELMTGKSVKYSKTPELMGAFGAALVAHNDYMADPASQTGFPGLPGLEEIEKYKTSQMSCKGCENNCRVTRFVFPNGKSFFSGNKCEKYYTAKGERRTRGFNFLAYKNDLIFNRNPSPHDHPKMTIGIPRCLNFYENFPFWHALFTRCRINIRLSSPSTVGLSEKGMGTIMSDNICFPAKLVHGHIYDLAQKKVDRIFYPIVMFEKKEYEQALNAYNCPIVSSYADVIESSIHPEKRFGIPLDRPVVNFNDETLLRKTCVAYLTQFNIKKSVIYKAFDAALLAREELRYHIRDKASKIIDQAQKNHSLLIVLAGRPYHLDELVNHKIPDILTGLGADIITEDAIPPDVDSLKDVQVVTQWSYPNRIYNAARWVARKPDNIQMVQLNSFGCGPDAIVIEEATEILKTGQKNHTLVKVDEISSPGSVRLRLRSMVESLKLKRLKKRSGLILRKSFLSFKKEDKKRTIWAPFFAEDYSPYLSAVFKNAGYEFKILPKPDRQSVDLGLQYANNDICYPGIIVIGDVIKALKNNTYRAHEIAIGITQTGGQCRASNYLSLIRKAMIGAGFDDIPIISVTASQGLFDQPGFQINWLMKTKILFVTTMFADCIAKMYYAMAPREKTKGLSQRLRQYYMEKVGTSIVANNYSQIFRLLEQAIDAFNEIPVNNRQLPQMGIVGEIYVKYNYFANQGLVHWLIRQGIEPVLPPIVDYFIQDLVNYKENIKAGIRRRKLTDLLGYPIEWLITRYHKEINMLFSKFKFYSPFEDIKQVAQKASNILTMTNQFGEGWLVPGEIATFAEQGIHHVISLQPFGCIANHIISKGMEIKIKSIYPDMNLYYLDFDAGMSEANIRNRLHFMIEHL
ncbi:MAG: acyl-CoA dehydratase activase [Desulfobacula sp.]|uniref:acyl-CoA dehydratase activase n=1 Tax=Desulfobacula sp. TaxID=2593537 RepID=UPI0025C26028|nr:acyl-CoA dehydratase activase [Desulfobacula sp.]MCD4721425.1 acyl-CoA dehydratase activase [Desulfobacula sp.]